MNERFILILRCQRTLPDQVRPVALRAFAKKLRLFYPDVRPLSGQTLSYTAGVIRRHRSQIGSAWRELYPGCPVLPGGRWTAAVSGMKTIHPIT
jgi:hypothetical protein